MPSFYISYYDLIVKNRYHLYVLSFSLWYSDRWKFSDVEFVIYVWCGGGHKIMSSEKKVIKISNHVYQPKHEILPKDLAEEVLRKFNAKPSQLPYITTTDKGIEDLEVRPGDIIKITRKSPTAGESVYYRYVVEG
jgi:DNA-directed RNA polymerase subunit H